MPTERLLAFLRFLVGVVIVGILVNFATDLLAKEFPKAKSVFVFLAAVALAMWLATILARIARAYLIEGRYAVEALILNSRNELLLYRHPHHKCMLPPGGRVQRAEFPNDALQRRLQERLRLEPGQYRFDDLVHKDRDINNGNLGEIQRLPAPFLVQRELHRQRTFVRFHYDLIYVLRLVHDDMAFEHSKYDPVHFVDLATLREMVAQKRTFPDVLDAYRRVLAVVESTDDQHPVS